MAALTLVKLGGSLLTDKRRPGSVRTGRLRRLARELAAAARSGVVVGHGSGSFGHVAAARHGVHRGEADAAGIAATQARAAALHRLVIEALLAAGAAPFSLAPSSFLSAAGGRPVAAHLEPLERALDAGLLPVLYGDVVLDRRQGAAICSTETVFLALAPRLARRGRPVRRVLWAGETEGVYDREGRLVQSVTPASATALLEGLSGAAGTDVTGGIRHRFETALALARLGAESWILDGRKPGRLEAALHGTRVPATRVPRRRS